jgi:hypothetical protein
VLAWLADNKEWLFGGAGITVIAALIKIFVWPFIRTRNSGQHQSSGSNSTNVQAGGNFNYNRRESKRDDEG